MDIKKKESSKFQVSDKRFWAVDDSLLEQAPVPDRQYPSYVEELKARTEAAERKLKDRIRDVEAENEGYRQRLTREMERRLEQEKLKIISDLLEVVDNLERALEVTAKSKPLEKELQALSDGVRLSLELMLSRLKSQGVEPVEALHADFDPHQAEAVGVVPVQDPALDQKVVEVVQRGYRYRDQLLRPARVRVGQYQA